jgi:5-methylcytosine-specific restriction enzyme A
VLARVPRVFRAGQFGFDLLSTKTRYFQGSNLIWIPFSQNIGRAHWLHQGLRRLDADGTPNTIYGTPADTPHLCAQPYCTNLVDGPGRCAEHATARTTASPAADHGYGARAWRNVRDAYIAAHPTCERCPRPAYDVHHRDGRRPRDPGANDFENLEALCRRCHRAETRRMSKLDKPNPTARGGQSGTPANLPRERSRAANGPEIRRARRGLR